MTVAAVILSATPDGAVADTLGQPRVRRLADLAWSGGALPIIVVSPDPDGAVAAALAGSEAVYGSPAPAAGGPVGQMVRAVRLVDAADPGGCPQDRHRLGQRTDPHGGLVEEPGHADA